MSNYPKVWAFGHPAVAELLFDPIEDLVITEKVDGSQINFGVFDDGALGGGSPGLRMCSKGADLYPASHDKMFGPAVHVIQSVMESLEVNKWYRGEYLQKPKHNTAEYSRVPRNHVILFDISDPTGVAYASYPKLQYEAARLGFEVVPRFAVRTTVGLGDVIADALKTTSVLGGSLIEGLVFKNYSRFGKDGKPLFAKIVRPEFKEQHNAEWTKPTSGGVIQDLVARFRTEARWEKAIQHLRDAGKLKGGPEDIGPLIAEIKADFDEECHLEVGAALLAWAMPQLLRAIPAGFPDYYKAKLLKEALDNEVYICIRAYEPGRRGSVVSGS